MSSVQGSDPNAAANAAAQAQRTQQVSSSKTESPTSENLQSTVQGTDHSGQKNIFIHQQIRHYTSPAGGKIAFPEARKKALADAETKFPDASQGKPAPINKLPKPMQAAGSSASGALPSVTTVKEMIANASQGLSSTSAAAAAASSQPEASSSLSYAASQTHVTGQSKTSPDVVKKTKSEEQRLNEHPVLVEARKQTGGKGTQIGQAVTVNRADGLNNGAKSTIIATGPNRFSDDPVNWKATYTSILDNAKQQAQADPTKNFTVNIPLFAVNDDDKAAIAALRDLLKGSSLPKKLKINFVFHQENANSKNLKQALEKKSIFPGGLSRASVKIGDITQINSSSVVIPTGSGATTRNMGTTGTVILRSMNQSLEAKKAKRQKILHKMAKLGKGINQLERAGMEGKKLGSDYIFEATTETHLPSSYDEDVQSAVTEWQQSGTQDNFDTWVKNNRDPSWLTNRRVRMMGVSWSRGQVKYSTTEQERAALRASFKDGKLNVGTKTSFENIGYDVDMSPIYVLGSDNEFYIEHSEEGKVHHSGFMAGGVVLGAGGIRVNDGKITMISDESGHYKPGTDHLLNVLKSLQEKGADISDIKVSCREFGGTGSTYGPTLGGIEFLKKITKLDYTNTVQILNTLEFLENNGVNTDNINIRQPDGKYVNANQYIKNLTIIHNTNPVDNAKQAINFLKGKGKDLNEIKTIITPPNTPSIALMKHMGRTPDTITFVVS